MTHITLNLIPTKDKQELRLVNVFLAIKNVVALALIGMIVIAFGLIAARRFLQRYYNDFVASNSLTQIAGSSATNDIKTVVNELTAMQQVQAEYVPFSQLLLELGDRIPPGVTLTDFSVASGGAAELSGVAARREDLLALHDQLVQSGLAADFAIPLATKFQEANIKFRLSLELRLPKLTVPGDEG